MKSVEITVNKLDAAIRQLSEAVTLFFAKRDPVAIHTLASAAHGLLHDLSIDRGLALSARQLLDKALQDRPELKKAVHSSWGKEQNFFKHADRDPTDTITFHSEKTTSVIFDAIEVYRELSGQKVPICELFQMWYFVHNSDLFDGIDHPAARGMLELSVKLRDKPEDWWSDAASKFVRDTLKAADRY